MNINYIILAHKNPLQVKRLVHRLISADSYFYIHIDKDADIDPFISEIPETEQIHFSKKSSRVNVSWGDISDVVATLNILKQITEDKRTGYCVLLSGQDYPIKSISHIQNFFIENNGKEFINTFPLPANRWPTGGLNRINFYKIAFSKTRGDYVLLPSVYSREFYRIKNFQNLNTLIRRHRWSSLKRLLNKRKFPSYVQPYGGSQWWALTIEAVSNILAFVHEHPDYLIYHEDTLLPDEIFFQSIIMKIFGESPERVSETVTYVNWTKKNVQLPAILTMEDLSELKYLPAGALFARKFDSYLCDEILTAIDVHLLNDEEFLLSAG